MAGRVKLNAQPAPAPVRKRVVTGAALKQDVPGTGSSYFANSTERKLEFVHSGCAVLDQVLGGGYVLGRMSNVIGDKSTGKTLLAIEACGNFSRSYADGVVRYVEAEAAFDKGYAAALGLDVDAIEWADMGADRTVEWVHDDILATIKRLNGRPCIYVVDSLDALSDREELKREISDNTYGAAKAKKLGEMFRRLVGEIEKSRLLLLIVSQIRDKIGVTFGETKMRAGGHAMDFYATHCLWLANLGQLKKTRNKIERSVGVDIRAKCKKNKVGLPFRECDFPILFGYGVDDLTANVEWLVKAGRESVLDDLGLTKTGYKISLEALRNRGGAEVQNLRRRLSEVVVQEWGSVETTFLPQSRKY